MNVLMEYESERQSRVIPTVLMTNMLFNLYGTSWEPMVLLRSIGLQAVNGITPLKVKSMHHYFSPTVLYKYYTNSHESSLSIGRASGCRALNSCSAALWLLSEGSVAARPLDGHSVDSLSGCLLVHFSESTCGDHWCSR